MMLPIVRVTVCIVSMAVAVAASGQERLSPQPAIPLAEQPPPAPPLEPGRLAPGRTTPRPVTVVQPSTPPAPAPARRARGRDVNVQLEITISDQAGTGTPERKVVSMVAADQTMGRIRASADAQRTGVGFVGTGLNVDARPTLLDSGGILLELTVEYTPFREGGTVTQRPTILNESLSVILQDGRQMVVSQAADPVTDRRMTVEVKATIVK